MGLSIIDASMHMLNDMKTFVEAEVKVLKMVPVKVDKRIKSNLYKRGVLNPSLYVLCSIIRN